MTLSPEQKPEKDALDTQLIHVWDETAKLFPLKNFPNCSWSWAPIPGTEDIYEGWADWQSNGHDSINPAAIYAAAESRMAKTHEIAAGLDCLDPPPYAAWERGELRALGARP